MRIDHRPTPPITDATQRPATAAPETARPATTDAASVVTIAAQVAEPGTITPAVAERIAKIKSALAKGEYPIDLGKLASRLVDDAQARSKVGGKAR